MRREQSNLVAFKDTEALSQYSPRQQAIDWLLNGKLDEYLHWALNDGHIAAYGRAPMSSEDIELTRPLSLDVALSKRIEEQFYKKSTKREFRRQLLHAFDKIPYYKQSPIEIIIRAAPLPVITKALQLIGTPLRTFKLGQGANRSVRWRLDGIDYHAKIHSFDTNIEEKSESRIMELSDTIPLISKLSSLNDHTPLLLLPLLLGRQDIAELMVRSGLGPDSYFTYFELSRNLRDSIDAIANDANAGTLLRSILAVDAMHLESAAEWLDEKGYLGQELSDLFDDAHFPDSRQAILSSLQQTTPITYYELMVATEHQDADLLTRLFEAGANPNASYRTGVPALARLDQARLTPKTLRIWLNAGANPIMGVNRERPFGDGLCPSPLTSAVWAGLTDIVKIMATEALEPIPLSYVANGKRWAPPLAIALNRNHDELALWMILERGESLDSLDVDYGEPVKTYASMAFMQRLSDAYLARLNHFVHLIAKLAKDDDSRSFSSATIEEAINGYRQLYDLFKGVELSSLEGSLATRLLQSLRALRLGADENPLWAPLWTKVTPDPVQSAEQLSEYVASSQLFDLVHAVDLMDDPVLLRLLGSSRAVELVRHCLITLNTERVAQVLAYVASGLNQVDHDDPHEGFSRLSSRDAGLTLATFFRNAVANRLSTLDIFYSENLHKAHEVGVAIYKPHERPAHAGSATDRIHVCFIVPATKEKVRKVVAAVVRGAGTRATQQSYWHLAKALQAMVRQSPEPFETELLIVCSGQLRFSTSKRDKHFEGSAYEGALASTPPLATQHILQQSHYAGAVCGGSPFVWEATQVYKPYVIGCPAPRRLSNITEAITFIDAFTEAMLQHPPHLVHDTSPGIQQCMQLLDNGIWFVASLVHYIACISSESHFEASVAPLVPKLQRMYDTYKNLLNLSPESKGRLLDLKLLKTYNQRASFRQILVEDMQSEPNIKYASST